MTLTQRGGWPYANPPNTQFTVNGQSPQAQGLVGWWSCFGQRGIVALRDMLGIYHMTPSNAPSVIANEWGPVLLFDDANAEGQYTTSAPISGPPFTMACWARPDADALNLIAMSFGDTSAASPYIALEVAGGAANNPVSFRLYDGASSTLFSTTFITFNEWNHMCGVAVADNDRRAYCNGRGRGTAVDNKSLAGADRLSIGVSADLTPLYYFSGAIAECRLYNRALSDAEVWALYNPATRWELYAPAMPRGIVGVAAGISLPLFMHHYRQMRIRNGV